MRKFWIAAVVWAGVYPMSAQAKGGDIDVMFYNVYNLFDARHDEGKNDWTFLPEGYPGKDDYCETVSNARYREECFNSDWTDRSVEIKIAQLADAIRDATDGDLPDMLGLCEVENPYIVNRLARELGYENFVMTDSPDRRGIDVALIYKEGRNLSYRGMEEHVMRTLSDKDRPTRNVLEVEFEIGRETLFVYVNHWPSQAAPARVRVNVAEQVQRIVDRRLRKSGDVHTLLMGDFNVVQGDYPHPFNSVLMNREARNPLQDVHDLFKRSDAPRSVKNQMPYGTYFYPPKMSWDRLDRFFISEGLADGRGLEVDASSYRILTPDRIKRTMRFDNPDYYSAGTVITGTPFRADIYATSRRNAGYSDHFPVFVSLSR